MSGSRKNPTTPRRAGLFHPSFIALALFVLVAILGPWVAPYEAGALDLHRQFERPSSVHLLGTGDNGVDLLSALLYGARLALRIALTVVLITTSVGTLIGIIAAFSRGVIAHAISSLMDVLQAFPSILLQVAILSLIADASFIHLVIALSLPGWVLYARIARAQAVSLRQSSFVEAAVALGVPFPQLLFRHLLPNLVGPIVVQATTAVGGVILAEATLSFLGLGPTKDVSWGALLDQGSGVLLAHPHVALISGVTIATVVLTTNLAGDVLTRKNRSRGPVSKLTKTTKCDFFRPAAQLGESTSDKAPTCASNADHLEGSDLW